MAHVTSLYELSGAAAIQAEGERRIAAEGLAEPYARIMAIFREVQGRHRDAAYREVRAALAIWAARDGDTDPGDEHRNPR